MQCIERLGLEPLQLGHKRRLRVLHLLLVPILLMIMYWYDWSTTTVITCSIFLAMVAYYSFAHALNRHVMIDPTRKVVEMETFVEEEVISEGYIAPSPLTNQNNSKGVQNNSEISFIPKEISGLCAQFVENKWNLIGI